MKCVKCKIQNEDKRSNDMNLCLDCYNFDGLENKREEVIANCIKCKTEFILSYDNKNALCKLIRSCKCGFNED